MSSWPPLDVRLSPSPQNLRNTMGRIPTNMEMAPSRTIDTTLAISTPMLTCERCYYPLATFQMGSEMFGVSSVKINLHYVCTIFQSDKSFFWLPF